MIMHVKSTQNVQKSTKTAFKYKESNREIMPVVLCTFKKLDHYARKLRSIWKVGQIYCWSWYVVAS